MQRRFVCRGLLAPIEIGQESFRFLALIEGMSLFV